LATTHLIDRPSLDLLETLEIVWNIGKVIFPSLNCLNETVQQIMIQECPMLQYHQDQRDKLQKTILFHLHELIAACVFETCTRTVGELFFSLPSSLV